jgi:hypothetical protein
LNVAGALSNHVSLTITQDSLGIARAGFGIPLILSHNATFPERIRFYTDIAGVAEDFADSSSPEYRAAVALFSQSPHPETIAIGRAAGAVTQKYEIAVASVRNSHTYSIAADGEGFDAESATYASDTAATRQEIANGLLTDLNTIVDKNYTATFQPLVFSDTEFTGEADDDSINFAAPVTLETGDGPFQVSNAGGALPSGLTALTDYWYIKVTTTKGQLATSLANALAGTAQPLSDDGTGTQTISDTANTVSPYAGIVVTGTAAGDWFSLEVDPADLSIEQTHADADVDDDLAAILLEDSSWYALVTLYNSRSYVLTAAAWCETNRKLYGPTVNETDAITVAENEANTDTLQEIKNESYSYTFGSYHPSPAEFFSSAWMGRCLPIEPGAGTWKFRNLAGVTPVNLTATQRLNLVNRRANSYEEVAGVAITFEGTVGSSTFLFIDNRRNLDWLEDDMSKEVFGALAGAEKIPFEDEGVSVIECAVRASCQRAVDRRIFARNPAPAVTVPKVASVSTSDKALRLLPNVKFSGTLAGAIHKVTVTGTVSV